LHSRKAERIGIEDPDFVAAGMPTFIRKNVIMFPY
jgi:hypothetical protein